MAPSISHTICGLASSGDETITVSTMYQLFFAVSAWSEAAGVSCALRNSYVTAGGMHCGTMAHESQFSPSKKAVTKRPAKAKGR